MSNFVDQYEKDIHKNLINIDQYMKDLKKHALAEYNDLYKKEEQEKYNSDSKTKRKRKRAKNRQ